MATSIDKRTKELAIIKASNELLEDVKNGLLERENGDEGVILQLNTAQRENLIMAKSAYGASEQDIQSVAYHGPSVEGIKEYEKRLKKKGITDEQLHQKDITSTTVNSKDKQENSVVKEEKQRRKRRTKKETPKTDTDTLKDVIKEAVNEDKKVEIAEVEPIKISDITNKNKDENESYNIEDYDLSSIPSYIQYDMIPLPSMGKCYSHKKSRVPVAYLTAADENIITAPNMYRDGKILDVILRRKILDKDFNVDELCTGDRDAILLWLRATAYGDEFPIVASDPGTGIQYNKTIKLSDFKYKDFKLNSDVNGLFDYETKSGDKIKFRFLTHGDEIKLREKMTSIATEKDKHDVLTRCKDIKNIVENMPSISDEDINLIMEDIDEVVTIVGEDIEDNFNETIPEIITGQMALYTISVNGVSDREYVEKYVENMRVGDARSYREYYNTNRPGVDLSIKVDIPESEGGGSFDTFLRIEDTIFINY